MGGAEGVVDVDVGQLRERSAEGGDGLRIGLDGLLGAVGLLLLHLALLLDVEAQVLEQHDRARRELGAGGLHGRADAVVEESDGLAQQLLQLGRDRLQGELGDLLSVRAAEVAGEDDRGALRERVLDRRQRGGDARVVGDGAGGLVLRDIEVDAHEHALAGETEVADGFEFRHGGGSSG
jgi:hypothetical protein